MKTLSYESFIDENTLIPMIYVADVEKIDIAALEVCGMKYDGTYFIQTRGDLDCPLLKKKMRKLDYKLVEDNLLLDALKIPKGDPNIDVMTIMNGNSVEDKLHADYIHFIKGQLIDSIKDGNEVYVFYENNKYVTAYILSSTIKISNSKEAVVINEFMTPFDFVGEYSDTSENIKNKFLSRHPEYKDRLKNGANRYYHTIEKV
jgi:hypothetical protein